MKRIITNIMVALLLLVGGSMALMPAVVSADAKADICAGVGAATGSAGCAEPDGSPSVNSTIALVVNILSFIVGVAAVIMIIIGGFKYVTSSGDSANITSAKNTILYAIVGLVVVALAQVIVTFVLNKASAPPACPEGTSRADDSSPCT